MGESARLILDFLRKEIGAAQVIREMRSSQPLTQTLSVPIKALGWASRGEVQVFFVILSGLVGDGSERQTLARLSGSVPSLRFRTRTLAQRVFVILSLGRRLAVP